MTKDSILMEFSDSRGRPLVFLRRAPNGEVLTVMMRYRDMTISDKDAVRGAFEDTASGKAIGGEFDTGIGDIEKFLAFEDDRPCG